jgi:hypothetical protein
LAVEKSNLWVIIQKGKFKSPTALLRNRCLPLAGSLRYFKVRSLGYREYGLNLQSRLIWVNWHTIPLSLALPQCPSAKATIPRNESINTKLRSPNKEWLKGPGLRLHKKIFLGVHEMCSIFQSVLAVMIIIFLQHHTLVSSSLHA